MKQLRRQAEVYFESGKFIVVPLDVNAAGHGITRPEPVILDAESPESLGPEIVRALSSVRGDAPIRPWENPDLPTLWGVLGYRSYAAFARSVRVVLVRQQDDGTVSAQANRRQGQNFLVIDHPGFGAPLSDPVAVGMAVHQAMELSS